MYTCSGVFAMGKVGAPQGTEGKFGINNVPLAGKVGAP
jgi:hypothetical protein